MIGGDLGTRALLKAIPIIRCSLASDQPFFFLCRVIFTYKRRRRRIRRKHILGKGPSYSTANANAYEIVISLIGFRPRFILTRI